MNEIDFGKYVFINYTQINRYYLELVLTERNKPNIRKWMNNNNIISLTEHIEFVDSLNKINEKYYWIVFRKNQPIGGINIIDIEYEKKTGIWGYFLFEKYHGTGWGIDVEFYTLSIFFNLLKLNSVYGYVHSKNIDSLTLQPIFNFKKIGNKDNQIILKLNKEDYERLPKDLREFKIKKIINNGNTEINS